MNSYHSLHMNPEKQFNDNLRPQLRPGECCVEAEVRAEVAAPLLQLDQDQVAEVLGVLSVKVEWDQTGE